MTTIIPFVPVPRAPFQFQPVLDGDTYTGLITWNLFGQRWYLNLYTSSGALVVTIPLIGSPNPIAVSSIAWNSLLGIVTLTTASPHGIPVGKATNLTLSGVTPSSYNGVKALVAQSATTLSYVQTTDPGAVTVTGAIGRDISLTAGYFNSTLVYRESSRNLEVSP